MPLSIQASIDIATGMAVQKYKKNARRSEVKLFRYRENPVVIYFVVDNKYLGRHNEKYVSSKSVQ